MFQDKEIQFLKAPIKSSLLIFKKMLLSFTYSKTQIDALVTGLLDLRGNFDASGGGFPTTGGSGTGGAILKGDCWKISVSGAAGQATDLIFALVDSPAQTAGNWDIIEGNLTESTFGTFSNGLTAKTTPIDADSMNLVDSAASNVAKKVTWANIKATLFSTSIFRPVTVEESLSATRTLTATEGQEFYFNPNGANRTVKMYSSPTIGDTRYIQNTGSAGNILTIQNNDGSSISGLPNIANGVGFRLKYLTAGWTLA